MKKYDYELIKKMDIKDYYELVKNIDNADELYELVISGNDYEINEMGCYFYGDGPADGFQTNSNYDIGRFQLHMMEYLKDVLELDLRDIYLGDPDLVEYEDDYDVKNYDDFQMGKLIDRYEDKIDAYDLWMNQYNYLSFLEEKFFEGEDI